MDGWWERYEIKKMKQTERERGRARDTGIQGYRDTEIQRCIELVRAIVWDKVAHV